MKCLDDCHRYLLDDFMGGCSDMLTFYKFTPDGKKEHGTTNEEVLRVLIHRMEALDEKVPCWENKQVISSLKGALAWLDARTEQRVKRQVEGTHKP